jgi:hypothetical protein
MGFRIKFTLFRYDRYFLIKIKIYFPIETEKSIKKFTESLFLYFKIKNLFHINLVMNKTELNNFMKLANFNLIFWEFYL